MLRQRHLVRLWVYEAVSNIPEGVEVLNAEEILPQDQFLRHRATNSPALGTNVFRYLLMKRRAGLWLDLDIILLAPIKKKNDYVFGWQDQQLICGAVSYIPDQSQLLQELLEFTSLQYPVPPFYQMQDQEILKERHRTGQPVHVSDLPWGVFGPHALTFFAIKTGAYVKAVPRSVFYPVYYSEAHGLVMASWDVPSRLTSETIAIHLWNKVLRGPSSLRPDNPAGKIIIERGSFVEKFARQELGMTLPSVV